MRKTCVVSTQQGLYSEVNCLYSNLLQHLLQSSFNVVNFIILVIMTFDCGDLFYGLLLYISKKFFVFSGNKIIVNFPRFLYM